MAKPHTSTQPNATAAPQPFASAIEALRWAFAAVPKRHDARPRPCRPADVLRLCAQASDTWCFSRLERLLMLRAAFGRLDSHEAASPRWRRVQRCLTQHFAAAGIVCAS
jgi:hypothetical protein